jgi:hypothetical protein
MVRSAAFALALLLTAAPSLAGGWAVTTLDELPSELRADQPYAIGYTLLQHGQTPYVGAKTSIEIRSASGETHVALARRGRSSGRAVSPTDPGRSPGLPAGPFSLWEQDSLTEADVAALVAFLLQDG